MLAQTVGKNAAAHMPTFYFPSKDRNEFLEIGKG
jgi:hypothetical protein